MGEASPKSARWSGGPFGYLLRLWRKRRKMPQADLAQRVGISAKHLSFLETGRSKPSKEVANWLAQALELSPDEESRLLEAAGFVGGYGDDEGDEERSAHVRQDIRETLRALVIPAVVHDRFGTIVAYNAAFEEAVKPHADLKAVGGDSSGHHLLSLLQDKIANWEEVVDFYRRRIEAELVREDGFDPTLAALHKYLGGTSDRAPASTRVAPSTFWYRLGVKQPDQSVRWFRCTTMTFGAPQDIAFRDTRLLLLLDDPRR